MSIAAGRLRNGASVSDTAAQVGYHSIAAFSRVFRNVLGVTPGEYRRQPGMQIKTNEQKMLTH
jgi:AraC-like DNA-binding protein